MIEHPPFNITGKTFVWNDSELVNVIPQEELIPFLLKIHEIVDVLNKHFPEYASIEDVVKHAELKKDKKNAG